MIDYKIQFSREDINRTFLELITSEGEQKREFLTNIQHKLNTNIAAATISAGNFCDELGNNKPEIYQKAYVDNLRNSGVVLQTDIDYLITHLTQYLQFHEPI